MFFGKIRENIKKSADFEKKTLELSWKNQGINSYYKCSTVALLSLFHSETAATVPQWHCYDRSTVRLFRMFHSDTVTIVPQWHCCDCSTVTLLRLFHSDTVTIVSQWHCYNCSTVTLLRLFHSKSFENKFYGLLTLFHSEIHC